MSSPIQLQVDLNEIIKKIAQTVRDARNLERDSSDIARDFQREIAWTEFYDGFIKTRVLGASDTIVGAVGAIQRAALIDAVNEVYRGWHDLHVLFSQQAQTAGLTPPASSATWPIPGPANGQTTRPGVWRGVSWALNGKSRARRTLDRIQLANQFLGTSIQAIYKYYGDHEPQSIPRPAETSTGIDASYSSFSTQIMRLAIRRSQRPIEMTLVKGPNYLQTVQIITFGPDSRLQYGLVAGSKPVLIEEVVTSEVSGKQLDQAVRLAMLLNQPPVDGFSVLPCLGIHPQPEKNRFAFIYDLTNVRKEMSENGAPVVSAESILPLFSSLHTQLSKEGGSGEQAHIFRHLRIHEAKLKPISISQRLSLAVCLAKTVQHMHNADWVHGNITSRNVYFFQERVGNGKGFPSVRIRNCYLFGFQFTRRDENYSDDPRREYLPPKDNFYRHPDRHILKVEDGQAVLPERPHRSHHDIYSLGVVLLELGLGRTAEEMVKLAQHLPGDSARRVPDFVTAIKEARSIYISLAENFLPGVIGDSYANITRLCLDGSFEVLGGGNGDSEVEEAVNLPTDFHSAVIDPLTRMLDAVS
ncbi:hypothetical protein V8F20_008878 [Naviculisporaceae sp. PSN 640]